ncbi:MAG: metallophosphoesterase [Eubacterium sp.]|nr:metallophosphoesterase [Eubacterium sp.]
MIIIIVFAVIFVLLLLYGYLSHLHLVSTFYEIKSDKISRNYRIVLLSDLHCAKHGKNNSKLIGAIDSAKPDAIFIAGDLTNKHLATDDIKVCEVLEFLKKLTEKYPVFYSDGNHEIRMDDPDEYRKAVIKTGVVYPENETVQYNEFSIYGLTLPKVGYYKKHLLDESIFDEIYANEPDDNKEKYHILLAHEPRYFEKYTETRADLILSGHIHGGIMRLPIVGGVIASGFQLFPKFDAGVYKKNDKTMVVSRGLGSHTLKFRFFNPPEIVIIDIMGG